MTSCTKLIGVDRSQCGILAASSWVLISLVDISWFEKCQLQCRCICMWCCNMHLTLYLYTSSTYIRMSHTSYVYKLYIFPLHFTVFSESGIESQTVGKLSSQQILQMGGTRLGWYGTYTRNFSLLKMVWRPLFWNHVLLNCYISFLTLNWKTWLILTIQFLKKAWLFGIGFIWHTWNRYADVQSDLTCSSLGFHTFFAFIFGVPLLQIQRVSETFIQLQAMLLGFGGLSVTPHVLHGTF